MSQSSKINHCLSTLLIKWSFVLNPNVELAKIDLQKWFCFDISSNLQLLKISKFIQTYFPSEILINGMTMLSVDGMLKVSGELLLSWYDMCVYDEHPLAGRDIQFQTPNSRSRHSVTKVSLVPVFKLSFAHVSVNKISFVPMCKLEC